MKRTNNATGNRVRAAKRGNPGLAGSVSGVVPLRAKGDRGGNERLSGVTQKQIRPKHPIKAPAASGGKVAAPRLTPKGDKPGAPTTTRRPNVTLP